MLEWESNKEPMNGIDKETLKQMNLDGMVKGLIDMIYHMHEENQKFWIEQPPKCQKTFIKVKHVKIASALIVAYLVGAKVISWAWAIKLFPFL